MRAGKLKLSLLKVKAIAIGKGDNSVMYQPAPEKINDIPGGPERVPKP